MTLKMRTAHDRWKAKDFRARIAIARDKSAQALKHMFVKFCAGIDARDVHGTKKRLRQGGLTIRASIFIGLDILGRGHVLALNDDGEGLMRAAAAMFERMRSL